MLISGLFVSSLFYGDPMRGITTSLQYFFCLFILPVVIAWRPLPQVQGIVKALVFAIILTCLFGIYLINIDGETNTRWVSGSGRMMSFLERENECAALIVLTVPLVCWLRNIGNISLAYFWFALIVLSYGVLLTGSNSGAIALTFVLFLQLIVSFSWKRILAAAASVAFIALALSNQGADYLPATFQKRVLGALTSGDIEQAGSFLDRVDLIKESLGVVNRNGLLGIGADQFEVISFIQTPVHNFYMLIWSEGGFLAFAGYLLLLLSGFLIGLMALKNANNFMAGVCTLSIFLTFAFLTNAFTHIYARFWFVPILTAISVSVSALYGPSNGSQFKRKIKPANEP